MDWLQIVEDRMLAIVHAGSRVHVIEADRMAQLMAERVAPRVVGIVFAASGIEKGVVHLDGGRLDVSAVKIELRQPEPSCPRAVIPVADLDPTRDRPALLRICPATNLVQGDR